ncbi:MAG TPA: hypothetical protein PKD37_00150 [Oligoflexia bacterium]|nr:hypothetical protein [Oligoflexia bacterium]HMP26391.1 hypothetical protein [Oligoflexia bacterium]
MSAVQSSTSISRKIPLPIVSFVVNQEKDSTFNYWLHNDPPLLSLLSDSFLAFAACAPSSADRKALSSSLIEDFNRMLSALMVAYRHLELNNKDTQAPCFAADIEADLLEHPYLVRDLPRFNRDLFKSYIELIREKQTPPLIKLLFLASLSNCVDKMVDEQVFTDRNIKKISIAEIQNEKSLAKAEMVLIEGYLFFVHSLFQTNESIRVSRLMERNLFMVIADHTIDEDLRLKAASLLIDQNYDLTGIIDSLLGDYGSVAVNRRGGAARQQFANRHFVYKLLLICPEERRNCSELITLERLAAEPDLSIKFNIATLMLIDKNDTVNELARYLYYFDQFHDQSSSLAAFSKPDLFTKYILFGAVDNKEKISGFWQQERIEFFADQLTLDQQFGVYNFLLAAINNHMSRGYYFPSYNDLKQEDWVAHFEDAINIILSLNKIKNEDLFLAGLFRLAINTYSYGVYQQFGKISNFFTELGLNRTRPWIKNYLLPFVIEQFKGEYSQAIYNPEIVYKVFIEIANTLNMPDDLVGPVYQAKAYYDSLQAGRVRSRKS